MKNYAVIEFEEDGKITTYPCSFESSLNIANYVRSNKNIIALNFYKTKKEAYEIANLRREANRQTNDSLI